MRPGQIVSMAAIVAAAAIGWAALVPSAPMEAASTSENAAAITTLEAPPPQVPHTRPVSPAGASAAPSNSGDLDLLRARNDELERRILAERAERNVEKEGTPVAAPAGLPSRYLEGALRDSLSKALAEAGFKDAKVTKVDCAEYPCIAFGEGIGEREELEKLKGTSALDVYARDSRQAFGFKVGDPPQSYFGMALIPQDDTVRVEDINRRLRHRMRDAQQSLALHGRAL